MCFLLNSSIALADGQIALTAELKNGLGINLIDVDLLEQNLKLVASAARIRVKIDRQDGGKILNVAFEGQPVSGSLDLPFQGSNVVFPVVKSSIEKFLSQSGAGNIMVRFNHGWHNTLTISWLGANRCE